MEVATKIAPIALAIIMLGLEHQLVGKKYKSLLINISQLFGSDFLNFKYLF